MKIKFSHLYEKMPPDFQVSRLLEIEIVRLEDLPEDFLNDDCRIVDGGYFPLPRKGKYIILWLESSIMNLRWQTIRRWTIEKEKYYSSAIGKLVDCVVGECPPKDDKNE